VKRFGKILLSLWAIVKQNLQHTKYAQLIVKQNLQKNAPHPLLIEHWRWLTAKAHIMRLKAHVTVAHARHMRRRIHAHNALASTNYTGRGGCASWKTQMEWHWQMLRLCYERHATKHVLRAAVFRPPTPRNPKPGNLNPKPDHHPPHLITENATNWNKHCETEDFDKLTQTPQNCAHPTPPASRSNPSVPPEEDPLTAGLVHVTLLSLYVGGNDTCPKHVAP